MSGNNINLWYRYKETTEGQCSRFPYRLKGRQSGTQTPCYQRSKLVIRILKKINLVCARSEGYDSAHCEE
jgi:hypothetical protein